MLGVSWVQYLIKTLGLVGMLFVALFGRPTSPTKLTRRLAYGIFWQINLQALPKRLFVNYFAWSFPSFAKTFLFPRLTFPEIMDVSR